MSDLCPNYDSAAFFVFSDIYVKHDSTAGCNKGPGETDVFFLKWISILLVFVPLASV